MHWPQAGPDAQDKPDKTERVGINARLLEDRTSLCAAAADPGARLPSASVTIALAVAAPSRRRVAATLRYAKHPTGTPCACRDWVPLGPGSPRAFHPSGAWSCPGRAWR